MNGIDWKVYMGTAVETSSVILNEIFEKNEKNKNFQKNENFENFKKNENFENFQKNENFEIFQNFMQEIKSSTSDWINFALFEYSIYSKYDDFTISASSIMISLRCNENEISLEFVEKFKLFLKNENFKNFEIFKNIEEDIEKCMQEMVEIMNREETDENNDNVNFIDNTEKINDFENENENENFENEQMIINEEIMADYNTNANSTANTVNFSNLEI